MLSLVQPYPYRNWPRMSRRQAAGMRRVARWLPLDRAESLASEASALFGIPIQLRTGNLHFCEPEALPAAISSDLATVVLASENPNHRLAIELEARLATTLIDRVLGGPGTSSRGRLSDVERGVLAYAAAQLVDPTMPWRVGTVLSSPFATLALLETGAIALTFQVQMDNHHYLGRLWLPLTVAYSELPPRAAEPHNVPLTMVVLAGRTWLDIADLEALQPRDIVLIDESHHEVAVRIENSHQTTWWCDRELALLRTERTLETLTRGHRIGTAMNNETTKKAPVGEPKTDPVQIAGDAPIQLSVELARFTMPLAELAALQPGEVVASGVRIGEAAKLRTSERAIATGELVDVDGEVGFRVISVLR